MNVLIAVDGSGNAKRGEMDQPLRSPDRALLTADRRIYDRLDSPQTIPHMGLLDVLWRPFSIVSTLLTQERVGHGIATCFRPERERA